MSETGILCPMSEAARAYLDGELTARNIAYSAASAVVGKNPAYIQQYIKSGKPLWLKEQAREKLVRAYPFLDASRLKPPYPAGSEEVQVRAGEHAERDTPQLGQVIDKPDSLVELLEIWSAIPADRREIAKRMLKAFID